MCQIIASDRCRCSTPARRVELPGPVTVLAATLRAAWWTLGHVVTPAVAVAVWWLSGPPVLPAARTHGRRYARRVHAAGRILGTAAAVAGVVWPVTTGVTLLVVGLALAGTAAATRTRTRRPAPASLPPRRVRAWVHTPPITHTPPTGTRPAADRTGTRA